MLRNQQSFQKRPFSLIIPVRVLDAIMVLLAGILSYAWYAYRYEVLFWPIQTDYIWLLSCGAMASFFAFSIAGPSIFSRGVKFFPLLCQTITGVLFLFAIIVGCLFILKQSQTFSRWWFFWWFSTSIFCLMSERTTLILILNMLRKRGFNQKRVVIVGAGRLGQSLATHINDAPWPSFQVSSFFDQRKRNNSKSNEIPVNNDFDLLNAYIEEQQIDEVWIALPLKAEELIEKVVNNLLETTATVRFLPDTFSLRLFRHHITEIYGFPMLDLSSPKMTGIDKILKTALDYFVSTVALLFLSPLLLFIAIAIKITSRGPVLFKQNRLGWDGKSFKVYKFRTMYMHKEEGGAITQATANDSRITPIGRLLRKTSCDELPQFFNVIQGRMSVVGPRPHVLEHNDSYRREVRHYMRRHKMKPGITGLAQVQGWRGETDTSHKIKKRIQHDLFYIENWSIGFDLKIILLTIFRGFIHPNAH
ncbi:MAG: undecaprenyl-phosphate glucose phosphotransferase [Phycisphaerae bacterium]|nr:undecaprenyl-phosphate glucose phosphotransferase [Phycisphaerae bacterium]